MKNCGVGFADDFSETYYAVTPFPHPNAVIARSAGVAGPINPQYARSGRIAYMHAPPSDAAIRFPLSFAAEPTSFSPPLSRLRRQLPLPASRGRELCVNAAFVIVAPERRSTVAFPLGGPNSPRTSRDLGPPRTPRGGGSRSETNEELAERENEIGC